MVSPEQGQKIPETATEAQVASGETTETSSDIPINSNSNNVDSDVVQDATCTEKKHEMGAEKVDADTTHRSGIVHTV